MVSKKRILKADRHMKKWDWEYILNDEKQKQDPHLGRLNTEDRTRLELNPENDLYSKKNV